MSAVAEYVMPEDEAQRLTNRITLIAGTVREGMEKLYSLVDEAKRGNAHVALGYPSWTAYLADTLGKTPLRLEREERREVVRYLAGEGMSARAIAPIVGVSKSQAAEDVRGVQNWTPAPALTASQGVGSTDALAGGAHTASTPAVDLAYVDKSTGEVHDAPVQKVTGMDGKTYTRPEPRQPSAPKRRPLTDQFFDAFYDLTKVTERIDRLTEDDRFPQNAEKVAAKHRSDLLRAKDLLEQVINRLPQA